MVNVGDILTDCNNYFVVNALNKTRTHAVLKCIDDESIADESYPTTILDTKDSIFMEADLGNTCNHLSYLAHYWFSKYEELSKDRTIVENQEEQE